jgi:hypothetical protein
MSDEWWSGFAYGFALMTMINLLGNVALLIFCHRRPGSHEGSGT